MPEWPGKPILVSQRLKMSSLIAFAIVHSWCSSFVFDIKSVRSAYQFFFAAFPLFIMLLAVVYVWTEEHYVLATLAFLTALVLASVVHSIWLHPMRSVPGPLLAKFSPLWIMSTLWRRRMSPGLAALHERHGPIVRIAPNEISFATVDSFDTIYHGASSKDGDFTKRGTLQDTITNFILPGPNIITMHNKVTHRKVKSRIEPALTPKALLQQEYLVRSHIQDMCTDLDKIIDGPQRLVNITECLSGMLWNMVSDLAFGEPLVDGMRKPFERFVENCTSMFIVIEALNFCLPVIDRLLRLLLESLPFPVTSGHIIQADRLRMCMAKTHERNDFLTAIMEDQKATGLSLTDRELQSNAAALFMAGYGTTAISISGILYQLLRAPTHIVKIQEELHANFKTPDAIEGAVLQHLPWLNACIHESLRLVPAINSRFAGRTSPGAVISGLYVPAGVAVFSDIYTIQRSSTYWYMPNEFRPERWLDDPSGRRPFGGDVKAAFRPFLLGTRACIGRQMALQTLRLMLANLLFRYDLDFPGKDDFVWERDVPSSLVWTDYRRLQVRVSRSRYAKDTVAGTVAHCSLGPGSMA